MIYKIEDELLLKQSLLRYQEKVLEQFPAEESLSEITFSEKFEKQMQKLIKAQRKPYYNMTNSVGKRFACAIVAVIILFSLMMSVSAIRVPFIKFIVKTFDKYSVVNFVEESTQVILPFEKIIPKYVPIDFKVVDEREFDNFSFIEYRNDYGNSFTIQQRYNDSNHTLLDTENTKPEKFFVNNNEVVYYEKSDTQYLVFTQGEYVFILIGNIEKEEIIKIAESIIKN